MGATNYYSAISMITILSMTVMVVCANNCEMMDKHVRRGFVAIFITIAISAAAEWCGVSFGGREENRRVLIAVKMEEFLLVPLIPLFWMATITKGKKALLQIPAIAVNLIAVALSPFFHIVFSVDGSGCYHRETFYWIYIASLVWGILLVMVESIKLSRQWQNRNVQTLLLIVLLIISSMVVQVKDSSIRIDFLSLAVGAMIYFIYYNGIIMQTDSLTKLLSRRSFDANMGKLRRKVVLFSIDVNDFKSVNDKLGHAKGDLCLKMVSDAMRKAMGRQGLCYRTGGDEFAMIMKGRRENAENVEKTTKRLAASIASVIPSFRGIAIAHVSHDPSKETAEEAIAKVDALMYAAKSREKEEF